MVAQWCRGRNTKSPISPIIATANRTTAVNGPILVPHSPLNLRALRKATPTAGRGRSPKRRHTYRSGARRRPARFRRSGDHAAAVCIAAGPVSFLRFGTSGPTARFDAGRLLGECCIGIPSTRIRAAHLANRGMRSPTVSRSAPPPTPTACRRSRTSDSAMTPHTQPSTIPPAIQTFLGSRSKAPSSTPPTATHTGPHSHRGTKRDDHPVNRIARRTRGRHICRSALARTAPDRAMGARSR